MYLGSPRMAEMVIGEKATLEEMGGARMHCSVSGCGDVLCKTEDEALEGARATCLSAAGCGGALPERARRARPRSRWRSSRRRSRADENKAVRHVRGDRRAWSTRARFFEIKPLFAREVVTGFARIDGKPVGVIANQPKWQGGVLFVDSADKAARFIQLCDAFSVPLLYLADVPGFMIGTKVERRASSAPARR